MKFFKTTLFAVLSFAFISNLTAQDIPIIEETDRMMSMGAKTAFVVKYEGANEKTVEDQWEKTMKSYKGKAKKNKAKELFADDVKMKDLSTNTVDVYATVAKDETGNVTILSVWYDLGGAFLNSEAHPTQAVAVKNMLDQTSLRIGAVMNQAVVDAEADTLKDMNKDLEKLVKEQEDGLEKIEEAKKLIAETEKMLEENATKQTDKKADISEQEKTLEAAKVERAKYPKL